MSIMKQTPSFKTDVANTTRESRQGGLLDRDEMNAVTVDAGQSAPSPSTVLHDLQGDDVATQLLLLQLAAALVDGGHSAALDAALQTARQVSRQRHLCAVKLQSVQRGHATRKALHRIEAAAVHIQARTRGCTQRSKHRKAAVSKQMQRMTDHNGAKGSPATNVMVRTRAPRAPPPLVDPTPATTSVPATYESQQHSQRATGRPHRVAWCPPSGLAAPWPLNYARLDSVLHPIHRRAPVMPPSLKGARRIKKLSKPHARQQHPRQASILESSFWKRLKRASHSTATSELSQRVAWSPPSGLPAPWPLSYGGLHDSALPPQGDAAARHNAEGLSTAARMSSLPNARQLVEDRKVHGFGGCVNGIHRTPAWSPPSGQSAPWPISYYGASAPPAVASSYPPVSSPRSSRVVDARRRRVHRAAPVFVSPPKVLPQRPTMAHAVVVPEERLYERMFAIAQ